MRGTTYVFMGKFAELSLNYPCYLCLSEELVIVGFMLICLEKLDTF